MSLRDRYNGLITTKRTRSNSNPEPPAHRRNFSVIEQDRRKRLSRTSTVLRPDPFTRGHPKPLRSNPVFVEEYPPHIREILRPNDFSVDNSASCGVAFASAKNENFQKGKPVSLAQIPDELSVGQAVKPPAEAGLVAGRASFIPTRGNLVTEILSYSPDRGILKAHSSVGIDITEPRSSNTIDLASQEPTNLTSHSRVLSYPQAAHEPPAIQPHDTPITRKRFPSMLPPGWNKAHDKFICYLDSHAPLTRHKHIPKDEERVPRYTYRQMLYMLEKKFPDFRKEKISIQSIDNRLQMLELQDNDYFRIPYHGYRKMDWGLDI